MDASIEREDPALGDRLPRQAAELRAELLRRLALLEREVAALAETEDAGAPSGALTALRNMEAELRRRLEGKVDSAAWSEERALIVELWRRHRRAFEELATRSRRAHRARPGQRQKGPRW